MEYVLALTRGSCFGASESASGTFAHDGQKEEERQQWLPSVGMSASDVIAGTNIMWVDQGLIPERGNTTHFAASSLSLRPTAVPENRTSKHLKVSRIIFQKIMTNKGRTQTSKGYAC